MPRPTSKRSTPLRAANSAGRLAGIERLGSSAAYLGKPYSDNPYAHSTPEHLAWSIGHNGARANLLLRSDDR